MPPNPVRTDPSLPTSSPPSRSTRPVADLDLALNRLALRQKTQEQRRQRKTERREQSTVTPLVSRMGSGLKVNAALAKFRNQTPEADRVRAWIDRDGQVMAVPDTFPVPGPGHGVLAVPIADRLLTLYLDERTEVPQLYQARPGPTPTWQRVTDPASLDLSRAGTLDPAGVRFRPAGPDLSRLDSARLDRWNGRVQGVLALTLVFVLVCMIRACLSADVPFPFIALTLVAAMTVALPILGVSGGQLQRLFLALRPPLRDPLLNPPLLSVQASPRSERRRRRAQADATDLEEHRARGRAAFPVLDLLMIGTHLQRLPGGRTGAGRLLQRRTEHQGQLLELQCPLPALPGTRARARTSQTLVMAVPLRPPSAEQPEDHELLILACNGGPVHQLIRTPGDLGATSRDTCWTVIRELLDLDTSRTFTPQDLGPALPLSGQWRTLHPLLMRREAARPAVLRRVGVVGTFLTALILVKLEYGSSVPVDRILQGFFTALLCGFGLVSMANDLCTWRFTAAPGEATPLDAYTARQRARLKDLMTGWHPAGTDPEQFAPTFQDMRTVSGEQVHPTPTGEDDVTPDPVAQLAFIAPQAARSVEALRQTLQAEPDPHPLLAPLISAVQDRLIHPEPDQELDSLLIDRVTETEADLASARSTRANAKAALSRDHRF